MLDGKGTRASLANKLREAMQQSRSLEKVFLKFAHSFMNQTANTAFSNGTATLEERLARWLLMAMTVLTVMRFRSPTSSCRSCLGCVVQASRLP